MPDYVAIADRLAGIIGSKFIPTEVDGKLVPRKVVGVVNFEDYDEATLVLVSGDAENIFFEKHDITATSFFFNEGACQIYCDVENAKAADEAAFHGRDDDGAEAA